MEKEMKKLLLVAVSVGVFLLVTITVALIVLTPKSQINETAFSSSVPYNDTRPITNIIDNISDQSGIADNQIAVNDRPEAVIAADRVDGDRLTIQVPLPGSTAIPDAPPPGTIPVATIRQAPAATQTPPASTTAVQTTTPAARPAPSASQTPTTPARTTQPAASTTPARTTTDFWIQTGAFSAIVRAEDAREALATKGLVSIIENRIIDGRVLYRVRLGPYASEREANHWLTIVQAIDGFNESQVRQTVRQN